MTFKLTTYARQANYESKPNSVRFTDDSQALVGIRVQAPQPTHACIFLCNLVALIVYAVTESSQKILSPPNVTPP